MGGISMAATVITKEPFDIDVTRAELEVEVELRIKAGAIKSWIEKEADQWVLYTEWNVIGQQ